MTLLEFESLELTEQLELVVDRGTPIAQIKTTRKGSLLYSLYNFYVELEMEYKKGISDVVAVHSFRIGPKLEKYLEQIDISELGLGKAA
jgi:hypothetical protein